MTVAPKRLAEIARGVAPLLDGNWRYDTRGAVPDKPIWGIERTIFNVDCPQMRFGITTPGEYSLRHKACARGDYSCFDYNLISRGPRHSINFSPARNVPALAADINRRFLPQFQEEWKRAQEEERKRKAEIEAYGLKVAMLRNVLPSMQRAWNSSDRDRGQFYADLAGLKFTVYGDTVTIENLELNLDQFVQLVFRLQDETQS